MEYKVGDMVVFKNVMFLFDATILEVYENNEFDEFDYYIQYKDYRGTTEDVLVKKEDIVGYAKGTEKHLKQEIGNLLETYSKDDILKVIDSI